MFLLCHPWLTTSNLSYRFPILETSATASCSTTGTIYSTSHCGRACMIPGRVPSGPCLLFTVQPKFIPGVPNAFDVTHGAICPNDRSSCVGTADLHQTTLLPQLLHILQHFFDLTAWDRRQQNNRWVWQEYCNGEFHSRDEVRDEKSMYLLGMHVNHCEEAKSRSCDLWTEGLTCIVHPWKKSDTLKW